MADPRQSLTNTPLKEAMTGMKKNNTPETRNIMLNEMMRATFLAPAILDFGKNPPKPDAEGKVKIDANTKISFQLINTQDGKQFFMAFTDWAELRKWNPKPGQQTLMLHFDDYASLLARNTKAAGFVVNPYTENLRFDPETVSNLKKQKDEFDKARIEAAKAQTKARARHKIDPGSKVVLVEPTVYPDAMLDPICEALEKRPNVQAAYIQVMIVNDTDKSYLMVLDCPPDEKLFAEVAKAAHPYMSENKTMNLDITVAASPLGQQALKGTEPFYTKALGRIRDEDDDE